MGSMRCEHGKRVWSYTDARGRYQYQSDGEECRQCSPLGTPAAFTGTSASMQADGLGGTDVPKTDFAAMSPATARHHGISPIPTPTAQRVTRDTPVTNAAPKPDYGQQMSGGNTNNWGPTEDLEIAAIRKCLEALQGFDKVAQGRIISYLTDRLQPEVSKWKL
jgi:hypothetical protein